MRDALRTAGDVPGHEFHGNQYTDVSSMSDDVLEQRRHELLKQYDSLLLKSRQEKNTKAWKQARVKQREDLQAVVDELRKRRWKARGLSNAFMPDVRDPLRAARLLAAAKAEVARRQREATIRLLQTAIEADNEAVIAAVVGVTHRAAPVSLPRVVRYRDAWVLRSSDGSRTLATYSSKRDAVDHLRRLQLKVASSAPGERFLGDVPGHEFHGNQYTSGVGGSGATSSSGSRVEGSSRDARVTATKALAQIPDRVRSEVSPLVNVYDSQKVCTDAIDAYLMKHYGFDTQGQAASMTDRERKTCFAVAQEPADVVKEYAHSYRHRIDSADWKDARPGRTDVEREHDFVNAFATLVMSEPVTDVLRATSPIAGLVDAALPVFKKWGWVS